MELHYKVVITENKKYIQANNAIVILGYKFIKSALSTDPNELPKDEDLEALHF